PNELVVQINSIKERERNKEKAKQIIMSICAIRPYKLNELSILLKKGDNYISRKYIKPMIDSGDLQYKFPEMINHPNQAYLSKKKIRMLG
ncbi:MAG: AAA family ATPase, partial [Bacteroidota bacterium]|nr:AAA family ATPase [Bacteroidota bacterium]